MFISLMACANTQTTIFKEDKKDEKNYRKSSRSSARKALLTSSFSGTFAFAASSERAGSVSFSGDDEVTLVKDTEDPNEYKLDLEALIGTMTLTTTDKAEKDVAVDSEDLSFRHAKGDNLISIKDGQGQS